MAAGLFCIFAQPAIAEEQDRWWVRAGVGYADFKNDVSIKSMGAEVPGASAEVKDNVIITGELGYRLTPNLSVAATFGVPPKTNLKGRGTVSGFGTLGEATYAPLQLSLQYQFNENGAFRPYVGVGYTYMKILSSKDAAIQNLEIDDTSGPVVLAGAEYWVEKNYGFYMDVSKYFLNTDARGTVGGMPAESHIVLDPVVIKTGIVFKF